LGLNPGSARCCFFWVLFGIVYEQRDLSECNEPVGIVIGQEMGSWWAERVSDKEERQRLGGLERAFSTMSIAPSVTTTPVQPFFSFWLNIYL
jgi:hypothetical protein